MATTLRIGAIGLGRAAANMIPAIAGHPNVELVGAADPNPQARARFEADFGGRTFADAEALCASGEIDAVYIATPHANHAPDVLTAARYRKHAIVEKPMALTLAECREMTAAAQRAGIALVIGHTHAYDPPHALMGSLIRSGEFGRLRQIVNLVYGNFLYRPRRPEELDSSLGGGIMYNQVPHQVEIIRTLATAPVRNVQAVTGVWDPARRTEGALAAFVTFEDGAVAQLTYSGYDHFDANELAFWISEGGEETAPDRHGSARRALLGADPDTERKMRTASGFAGGGAVRGKAAMHEQHFGFLLASCERADLRPLPDGVRIYADDGVRDIPVPRGRVYPNKDAVIDEFYAAAVDGVPPVHDGAWGTETTAIALALVESARTGTVVSPER